MRKSLKDRAYPKGAFAFADNGLVRYENRGCAITASSQTLHA